MKSLTLSPTLFGIDLRQLGHDWSRALALMTQWPGIRWFTPQFATRLQSPSGHVITCIEKNGCLQITDKQTQTPFTGVLLPDDLVLWRTLTLPTLHGEALDNAIQLEIERLNPFPKTELLSATHKYTASPEQLIVHIAITSTRLVDPVIIATPPSLPKPGQHSPPAQPEVWARVPDLERYVIFRGFGETARLQRTRNWRMVNLLLVTLIILVCAAAALTPTLQMRNRTLEANSDFQQLQAKARKAVLAREHMTQLHGKVQQLQTLVGKRMVPEHLLLLLTRYVPDDTYILSLDIKGTAINMTGITTNASALMQHLGKQPGVTQVTAPSAARRERDKEVFTLAFTLTPEEKDATPQQPVAAPKTKDATEPSPQDNTAKTSTNPSQATAGKP